MIIQLLEAIADVKMWNIPEKSIVILAPLNTLEKLMHEELINGKEAAEFCLSQPTWMENTINRFSNILVIEDASLTQIVVKSLVSDHRAVIQQ